jgi:hypothetical protein
VIQWLNYDGFGILHDYFKWSDSDDDNEQSLDSLRFILQVYPESATLPVKKENYPERHFKNAYEFAAEYYRGGCRDTCLRLILLAAPGLDISQDQSRLRGLNYKARRLALLALFITSPSGKETVTAGSIKEQLQKLPRKKLSVIELLRIHGDVNIKRKITMML